MNRWVILSKTKCPWCVKAEAILHEESIPYSKFDIDEYPDLKQFLLASGLLTVPQVFKNGILIGGYDDLFAHLTDKEDNAATD